MSVMKIMETMKYNESLDVSQKIYDYMAEDLSLISEQDKLNLENVNNEMEEKSAILKQEFKTLDESKNFKERSKNRNKTNCRSNKIKP